MSDQPTHVQVRFHQKWREYVRGDVATFPIDVARQLHVSRVAEGLQGFGPMREPEAPSQPQRAAPPQNVRK
jgi:hypothetical protein